MKPIAVTDLDMAFGGKVRDLLPAFRDLPKEFQNEQHEFCGVAADWFFKGLKKEDFRPKEGIDADAAWRHLRAIMGSWEPKHEHKISGVGYLMSLWFDRAAATTGAPLP